jgi:hypothetical protein
MVMEKNQFLDKDLTIRKSDGSHVRGICIHENTTGVTIQIQNTDRVVFVPYNAISEIITGGSTNG